MLCAELVGNLSAGPGVTAAGLAALQLSSSICLSFCSQPSSGPPGASHGGGSEVPAGAAPPSPSGSFNGHFSTGDAPFTIRPLARSSWAMEVGCGCNSLRLHQCPQTRLSPLYGRCVGSPSHPTTKYWRRTQAGGWRATVLAKHRSWWSRTDPAQTPTSPAQQCFLPC